MKQIGFVCKWEKNAQTSWSGTNYGLFVALQKYFRVENIDIKERGFSRKVYRKVLETLHHDFSTTFLQKEEDHFTQLKDNIHYPTLQFDEFPFFNPLGSFIYQDLCVGSILNLYHFDKNSFLHSGYESFSESALQKRWNYQKSFYSGAKGIFTMGSWFAVDLVQRLGIPKEKVFSVGGGINIDRNQIDFSKKQGKRVLFVGKDFERKNGPLVVEAFKKARQSNKDLELYIVGPKYVGVTKDNIHWLGTLPIDQVLNYFNLCDVFCMPSIFEAYGLVFPEALCCGLPCIGRNAFEMPYFIQDGKNGYLLNTNSSDELAFLIHKAIANRAMARSVQEKQNEYLSQYSWNAVAKRISDAITNISFQEK